MTIEQRVAVLEEIFAKLRDYYILLYSGEEIDALLASAGVPIGITKEYDSVSAMNDDFSSTDVARGQFVLVLPTDTSSEDYGKVYLKGSANWVYVFTLTSLTAIKGPQGPAGKRGAKGADGADGKNFMVLGYYETLSALNAAVPSPGPGDTYGVGTEPPYAFYMYDQTISNWRYVGNLQGPAGPTGGEDNFVRYDAAQTLTDEQKAQARTNIGADAVQGTVRYDATQTLTDAQKQQARGNIAAANRSTQDKVLAVSVPTRSISLAASEVQGYLDALPRLLTEGLEIKISGTVPETLTIRNFYGSGGLTITNQSGQTYALTKGMLLDNCDIPIIVLWATITVDTAQETPYCVSISNTKYVYMSNCVLTGNGASRAVTAMGNQSTVLVSCTMKNHNICAFAYRGAVLTITGGTFADNTTGAYVYDGGVILLGGTTPNLLGGTANSHGGGVIVSANGTVI